MEPGKFYKWIRSLCRIFFATEADRSKSEVPKMTRSWMLEVMDSPVSPSNDEPIETKPLSASELTRKVMKKATSTGQQMKSSAVLPNNALLKEEAPKIEITTTRYIQNMVAQNQSWKQRNVGNVHLPKAKVAVNTVSPLTKSKENQQSEDTTEDSTSNEYDEETNNFNFEEIGLSAENSSPIDITTASDEIIAQLEQSNYDEEMIESRLRQYRYMAEEEEESINDDESAGIQSESSEDEDYIINSDDNQLYIQEEEDIQENVQEGEEEVLEDHEVPNVANEEEVYASEENTFPSPASQTIPLSLDFLDSLGRLWEEKAEWYKKMSNTKLFDGRGRPIQVPPVQTQRYQESIPEDSKENENYSDHLSNTVYVDVGSAEMKEIEKYSTKRKFSTTNDDDKVREKKLKTAHAQTQHGLDNIRRLLNLPCKSNNTTSDKATTATSNTGVSRTASKRTQQTPTPLRRTAPTSTVSRPTAPTSGVTACRHIPVTAASKPTSGTPIPSISTPSTPSSKPAATEHTYSSPISCTSNKLNTNVPKLIIPTKTYGQKDVEKEEASHTKAQHDFKMPIPTKDFLEQRKKKGT